SDEHGESPRSDASYQRARRARSRRAVADGVSVAAERAEVVAQSDVGGEPRQAIECQAHDGEVVAIHALDDRRAVALNAVRAGFVHRLAGIDISLDLLRRERTEGHADFFDAGCNAAVPANGDTGHYHV